ncbi:MAG: GrrA/OscA1 family cyclophane-containing rSAM-modified RiPP [Microcystaceae cyanobacterium]
MSKTSQITLVGCLLAVSTLSIPTASANCSIPVNSNTVVNIEERLSRLTNAIEKRGVNLSKFSVAQGQTLAGFANRGGGGGFVNRGGSDFVNRSNGGGFVNRSPWKNGGSFYNRS